MSKINITTNFNTMKRLVKFTELLILKDERLALSEETEESLKNATNFKRSLEGTQKVSKSKFINLTLYALSEGYTVKYKNDEIDNEWITANKELFNEPEDFSLKKSNKIISLRDFYAVELQKNYNPIPVEKHNGRGVATLELGDMNFKAYWEIESNSYILYKDDLPLDPDQVTYNKAGQYFEINNIDNFLGLPEEKFYQKVYMTIGEYSAAYKLFSNLNYTLKLTIELEDRVYENDSFGKVFKGTEELSPYYKDLFSRGVDLVQARTASHKSIIYYPKNILNNAEIEKFLDCYYESRENFKRNYYNKTFNVYQNYIELVDFLVIMLTMQKYLDLEISDLTRFELMNEREIENLLLSYGLTNLYYLPKEYKIKLITNMVELLKIKGTDEVLKKVNELFSIDGLSLYKYLLIAAPKYDEFNDTYRLFDTYYEDDLNVNSINGDSLDNETFQTECERILTEDRKLDYTKANISLYRNKLEAYFREKLTGTKAVYDTPNELQELIYRLYKYKYENENQLFSEVSNRINEVLPTHYIPLLEDYADKLTIDEIKIDFKYMDEDYNHLLNEYYESKFLEHIDNLMESYDLSNIDLENLDRTHTALIENFELEGFNFDYRSKSDMIVNYIIEDIIKSTAEFKFLVQYEILYEKLDLFWEDLTDNTSKPEEILKLELDSKLRTTYNKDLTEKLHVKYSISEFLGVDISLPTSLPYKDIDGPTLPFDTKGITPDDKELPTHDEDIAQTSADDFSQGGSNNIPTSGDRPASQSELSIKDKLESLQKLEIGKTIMSNDLNTLTSVSSAIKLIATDDENYEVPSELVSVIGDIKASISNSEIISELSRAKLIEVIDRMNSESDDTGTSIVVKDVLETIDDVKKVLEEEVQRVQNTLDTLVEDTDKNLELVRNNFAKEALGFSNELAKSKKDSLNEYLSMQNEMENEINYTAWYLHLIDILKIDNISVLVTVLSSLKRDLKENYKMIIDDKTTKELENIITSRNIIPDIRVFLESFFKDLYIQIKSERFRALSMVDKIKELDNLVKLTFMFGLSGGVFTEFTNNIILQCYQNIFWEFLAEMQTSIEPLINLARAMEEYFLNSSNLVFSLEMLDTYKSISELLYEYELTLDEDKQILQIRMTFEEYKEILITRILGTNPNFVDQHDLYFIKLPVEVVDMDKILNRLSYSDYIPYAKFISGDKQWSATEYEVLKYFESNNLTYTNTKYYSLEASTDSIYTNIHSVKFNVVLNIVNTLDEEDLTFFASELSTDEISLNDGLLALSYLILKINGYRNVLLPQTSLDRISSLNREGPPTFFMDINQYVNGAKISDFTSKEFPYTLDDDLNTLEKDPTKLGEIIDTHLSEKNRFENAIRTLPNSYEAYRAACNVYNSRYTANVTDLYKSKIQGKTYEEYFSEYLPELWENLTAVSGLTREEEESFYQSRFIYLYNIINNFLDTTTFDFYLPVPISSGILKRMLYDLLYIFKSHKIKILTNVDKLVFDNSYENSVMVFDDITERRSTKNIKDAVVRNYIDAPGSQLLLTDNLSIFRDYVL